MRREGQSRGFGFVTFKDEISVEKCLLVNHFIKGKKVELKRAVPKVRVTQTTTSTEAGTCWLRSCSVTGALLFFCCSGSVPCLLT